MRQAIYIITLVILATLGFAGSSETHRVTINPPDTLIVNVGVESKLNVEIFIREGYHIQANPVRDPFLIPTTIAIKSQSGIVLADPIYPEGHLITLAGAEDSLAVYSDRVVLEIPFIASTGMKAGNYTIEGTFRYQACDAKRCFIPRTEAFVVQIKVSDSKSSARCQG